MKRPTSPSSLAAFAAARLPAAHDGASGTPRPQGASLEEALDGLLDELPDDFDEAQEAGARVACAWRVARAIAESRGYIGPEEPLSAAPPEGWTDPDTPSYVQGQPSGAPAWRTEIEAAPVALLPTASTLEAWADAAWLVATRLDLLGSLDGKLGVLSLLEGLEDDDDVPGDFPDRAAVLALEEALVSYTIATATVSPTSGSEDSEVASIHKARTRLTEGFHLAPCEVESLLVLAQQRALEGMAPGEQLRSMQLLGLDDLARRAANSLDLGAEIAARRLFAQVSGVTRSVPEDTAQEFLAVIKRVSARQDAEVQLEGRTTEGLSPARARRCEEVESIVLEPVPEGDEFDADALREFDAENGEASA